MNDNNLENFDWEIKNTVENIIEEHDTELTINTLWRFWTLISVGILFILHGRTEIFAVICGFGLLSHAILTQSIKKAKRKLQNEFKTKI